METTDREVLLAEGVPLTLTDGTQVQIKYTGRSVAHLEQQFGSVMAMQRLFFGNAEGLQCDGFYNGRQLRHAPPPPAPEVAASAIANGAALEAAQAADDVARIAEIREQIAELDEENTWHEGDECPKCQRNQRASKDGAVSTFHYADAGPKFEPLTRLVACGVEHADRWKGLTTAQVADALIELLDPADQLTARFLAMQALSETFGLRKAPAAEAEADGVDPTTGTETTIETAPSPGDSSGTLPLSPSESPPVSSGA